MLTHPAPSAPHTTRNYTNTTRKYTARSEKQQLKEEKQELKVGYFSTSNLDILVPAKAKVIRIYAGKDVEVPQAGIEEKKLMEEIARAVPVVREEVARMRVHIKTQDMRVALLNTAKLLQPGGIFRMIVPDLRERARRYVEAASEGDALASHKFLESSYLGLDKRPATIFQHARLALGGSQHLWMWDEHSLRQELENAGFTATRRCEYGDSEDPMFAKVEEKNRFYDDAYGIKECALEARIPA